jgi:hypothetical protein
MRRIIVLIGSAAINASMIPAELIATACHPYRPERHYMRGPGPKWFAKHGAGPIGRSFEAQKIKAY